MFKNCFAKVIMLLELLPIYNLPLIKHTLAILLYCYILSDNISKLLIIQVYSQFPAFGSSTASPFGGVTPANPFATTAPSAFGASQGTSIFGSTPIENLRQVALYLEGQHAYLEPLKHHSLVLQLQHLVRPQHLYLDQV